MRYILTPSITQIHNGEEKITPNINGEFVKNRDQIFINENYNSEMNNNLIFDYLIPEYIEDYKNVEFLCDFHSWIQYKPKIYSFPISKKMKEVLENFNLYPKKFYPAKVLFQDEFHDYFVWQLFLDGFDKFVDFEHSTFCEWKYYDKIGSEILSVKSEEEISDLCYEKEWRHWGFKRAVMKPEFKELDCMVMPYPYGILISERLKYFLEDAELTGFEIKPFPVEFEYL